MVGSEEKNPTVAAIASFFIPGLGQIYNGEGLPVGVLWLIGAIVGSLFMFIPGVFVWLYGIYNAYKVAEEMNAGLLPVKAYVVSEYDHIHRDRHHRLRIVRHHYYHVPGVYHCRFSVQYKRHQLSR